jgi:Domain of unknown function (DUF4394)
MRITITSWTARRFFAAVAIGSIAVGGLVQPLHATGGGDGHFDKLRVFGLTDDGRLVRFRADAPRRTKDLGYIAGLTGSDTALVGIDFRVQDGKLYGVGNGGGVYH